MLIIPSQLPFDLSVPVASASFVGGDGSSGSPFQISTLVQLQNVSSDHNAYYELINDIDASASIDLDGGLGFDPICNMTQGFTGQFDGQGYTITGLTINRPTQDYVGLFGVINRTGAIFDVHLVDANIVGQDFTGAIAGHCNTTANNCSVNGTVNGRVRVGGLFGECGDIIIADCLNTAKVQATGVEAGGVCGWGVKFVRCENYGVVYGSNRVGGIVGKAEWGFIIESIGGGMIYGNGFSAGGVIGQGTEVHCYRCAAYGRVESNYKVGGFFGKILGHIYDSYSTAQVVGSSETGGFGGQMINDHSTASINDCYSCGGVTGDTMVSTNGFLGDNIGGTFSNNYFDTDTSGDNSDAAATGDTTANLMKSATFSGWDFTNTWNLVADEVRPYLRHEPSTTIYSAHHLQLMMLDLSADYDLAIHVDMVQEWHNGSGMTGSEFTDGVGFRPVGASGTPFTGTLKGNNHTIRNLLINRSGQDGVGLFGVTNGAEIKDLNLEGFNITGRDQTGSLVGEGDVTISYTYVEGKVVGADEVGGMIGKMTGGDVDDTYIHGRVAGVNTVGGLIGAGDAGTVDTSYSTAFVTATTGEGLFGSVGTATITSCFWDNQTSGYITSAGGTGRNTSMMMTQSMFVGAGWNFTGIWEIKDGYSYPYFARNWWNYFPQGFDDLLTTDEDTILTIMPMDILGNDIDPDGIQTVSIYSFDTYSKLDVRVELRSNGSLRYNTTRGTSFNSMALGEWFIDSFNYTLTDHMGKLSNATVTVNLTGANDLPTAIDDSMFQYEDGATPYIELIDDDVDPDTSDALTAIAVTNGTYGTVVLAPNGSGAVYTPDPDFWGVDTFTYTLSDDNGGQDTGLVTVTVNNTNDEPVLNVTSLPDATQDIYYNVTLNATDIDPTGDIIKWNVTTDADWLAFRAKDRILFGTPANADIGTYWVNIAIHDGRYGTDEANISLEVINVNDAPTIDSYPVVWAVEDLSYQYQIVASDIDKLVTMDEELYFSLDEAPDTMVIDNNTGLVYWVPTNDDAVLYHNVTVNVTDEELYVTQSFQVFVNNTNDDPEILTEDVKTAYEGSQYRVDYNATDPDPTKDKLVWTMKTDADWLRLIAGPGLITGTPEFEDIGTYWVNMTVDDQLGGMDFTNFSLEVVRTTPLVFDIPVGQTLYTDDVIATNVTVMITNTSMSRQYENVTVEDGWCVVEDVYPGLYMGFLMLGNWTGNFDLVLYDGGDCDYTLPRIPVPIEPDLPNGTDGGDGNGTDGGSGTDGGDGDGTDGGSGNTTDGGSGNGTDGGGTDGGSTDGGSTDGGTDGGDGGDDGTATSNLDMMTCLIILVIAVILILVAIVAFSIYKNTPKKRPSQEEYYEEPMAPAYAEEAPQKSSDTFELDDEEDIGEEMYEDDHMGEEPQEDNFDDGAFEEDEDFGFDDDEFDDFDSIESDDSSDLSGGYPQDDDDYLDEDDDDLFDSD